MPTDVLAGLSQGLTAEALKFTRHRSALPILLTKILLYIKPLGGAGNAIAENGAGLPLALSALQPDLN